MVTPANAYLTVWTDGTWRVWDALSAHYAASDPDWLASIPVAQIAA